MTATEPLQFIQTGIPGLLEVRARVFEDARGTFVKSFHEEIFRRQGLTPRFVEEYHTTSHRGVLRGLHFQVPPADHAKLVCCVHGEAVDVVVDLRAGSPTFGQHHLLTLDGRGATALYIPAGLAHGFYVTGETATLLYRVTSVYSPEHDAGIRWNSCGIPWPGTSPIISARDAGLPTFQEFATPFRFGGGA